MVLKNKKEQKYLHNSSNVDVGEDKISKLPDQVIHQILSLLPIKCAMSTCILSKRWKYLSNSTPNLDFRKYCQSVSWPYQEQQPKTQQFMNFLDTVLFHHEKPKIQKFDLFLMNPFFDESRVNRWISTIMKRDVEEFGLSFRFLSPSSTFPLSCFTCDTLTQLSLGFNVMSPFKIPNTVSLPKLKILRLAQVQFADETSTTNLFSNCPILEDLSLYVGSMSAGLCIMNPTLKHLDINFRNSSKFRVKISAPNLLTLSCKGEGHPADFVLDGFPSLVEADIWFDFFGRFNPRKEVLIKILEKLSSAKLLKIGGHSILADILFTGSLTFNNLSHLEIISPAKFYVQGISIPDKEDDDGWWSVDPKCSLPQLKSIKFKNIDGKARELNAIKQFLNKYAGSLETVTIVASPRLSKGHEQNMAEQLLMCPKPSNCVIKFLTSSEDT